MLDQILQKVEKECAEVQVGADALPEQIFNWVGHLVRAQHFLMSALNSSVDKPKPAPHLLTVNQAAEKFSVSAKTIYRMAATGRLNVHRMGRAIRVYDEPPSPFRKQARVKRLVDLVEVKRDG